jgi:hypothetical protein
MTRGASQPASGGPGPRHRGRPRIRVRHQVSGGEDQRGTAGSRWGGPDAAREVAEVVLDVEQADAGIPANAARARAASPGLVAQTMVSRVTSSPSEATRVTASATPPHETTTRVSAGVVTRAHSHPLSWGRRKSAE